MQKLLALLKLFRRGNEVANAAAWKNGQITANVLAGLVLAAAGAAQAFGLGIEVSDADALAMGGGVLAVANVVLTVVTSRKVGLPAGSESDRPAAAAGPGDSY